MCLYEYVVTWSRDSSVSIVMGYGLDGWCSIPDRGKISLLHSVQTGCGTQPASYPMCIGGSFPGGKAVEE
jgi:hypothetical protein